MTQGTLEVDEVMADKCRGKRQKLRLRRICFSKLKTQSTTLGDPAVRLTVHRYLSVNHRIRTVILLRSLRLLHRTVMLGETAASSTGTCLPRHEISHTAATVMRKPRKG